MNGQHPETSRLHPQLRAVWERAVAVWRERFPARPMPRIVDVIRSTREQANAYRDYIAGRRPNNLPVAPPGRSLHEQQRTGYAHALDFGFGGRREEAAWYRDLANIVRELDPSVQWGGTWRGEMFDPVHLQLPRTAGTGATGSSGATVGGSARAATGAEVKQVSQTVAYVAATLLLIFAIGNMRR